MYPGKNLRIVVRFSPLTISTTFSAGTMTSTISSLLFIDFTRASRANLAVCSYPEYVWTMYHLSAMNRLYME